MMGRCMQNAPHYRELRALPDAVITSHHITVRVSLVSHRTQHLHMAHSLSTYPCTDHVQQCAACALHLWGTLAQWRFSGP